MSKGLEHQFLLNRYSGQPENNVVSRDLDNTPDEVEVSLSRIRGGLGKGVLAFLGGMAVLGAKEAQAGVMGGPAAVEGIAYCAQEWAGTPKIGKDVLGSSNEDITLQAVLPDLELEPPVLPIGRPYYWQGKVFVVGDNADTAEAYINVYDTSIDRENMIGQFQIPTFDGPTDHILNISPEGLMYTTEGIYQLHETQDGQITAEHKGDIGMAGKITSFGGMLFVNKLGSERKLCAISEGSISGSSNPDSVFSAEHEVSLPMNGDFNGSGVGADPRSQSILAATQDGYYEWKIPSEAKNSDTGEITDMSWMNEANMGPYQNLGYEVDSIKISDKGLRFFTSLYFNQGAGEPVENSIELTVEYLGQRMNLTIGDLGNKTIRDIQILPNNKLLIVFVADGEYIPPAVLSVQILETYPMASTTETGEGGGESTVQPTVELSYSLEDAPDFPFEDAEVDSCSTIPTAKETCDALPLETDSDCTEAVCDSETLTHTEIPLADGEYCDDDNPDTVDDECEAGECVGIPVEPDNTPDVVEETTQAEYNETVEPDASEDTVEETNPEKPDTVEEAQQEVEPEVEKEPDPEVVEETSEAEGKEIVEEISEAEAEEIIEEVLTEVEPEVDQEIDQEVDQEVDQETTPEKQPDTSNEPDTSTPEANGEPPKEIPSPHPDQYTVEPPTGSSPNCNVGGGLNEVPGAKETAVAFAGLLAAIAVQRRRVAVQEATQEITD